MRRPRNRAPWIVGGMAIAASIALVAWWRWPQPEVVAPQLACNGDTGFAFTAKTGTVVCGGASVAKGVLPIGTTLDTGAHEAELKIAKIGAAQLGERTRVRLDRTSAVGHQLFLEQGHMHARVDAPPRIFAVVTPSAHVTDLGCEYTLDIDSRGAGKLHVITGKVELETGTGALVVAPRGTHANLLPGRRPSVPLSDKAGPVITAAVRDLEANVDGALDRVLAAATVVDAITIANLAEVVPDQKRKILERLAKIVPPPQDLTIDEALSDRALYEMWFDECVLVHLGASTVPPR
jgi:hypothetical protein